jgi:hypothetical protein
MIVFIRGGNEQMKNVLLGTLLAIGIIVGMTAIGFYSGFIGNIYDATVGKQHMDVERTNFKESKSYVEGMIQDLAKYKRQYDQAQTDSDKKTILNFVNNEFANFDASKIEDSALLNFLNQARGE